MADCGNCAAWDQDVRRTSAAREGTPTVTTSLQPPATEPSRKPTRRRMTEPSFGDSFEIVPPANGVPRSAWFRARRMSTWHRPYAVVLLGLDFLAVALANLTVISVYEKAPSGFDHDRGLF